MEGRRYVHFAAGIAVTNTGHRHPKVIAAVAEQAQAFTHTCMHVSPYESYVALAQQLTRWRRGPPRRRRCSCRPAPRRWRTLSRSRATPSHVGHHRLLPGLPRPHHHGDGADPQGDALQERLRTVPGRRLPLDLSHAFHGLTLERALTTWSGCRRLTSIPGGSWRSSSSRCRARVGFNIAPPEFLRSSREIADKHGILLIADEIQSGIALTGKMFGIEHSWVAPYLVITARASRRLPDLGGHRTRRGTDAAHPGAWAAPTAAIR